MSTQDPHIASASGTPFHKPKREKVPHSSTSPTQADIEHTNAGRMWIAVAMGAIVVIILLGLRTAARGGSAFRRYRRGTGDGLRRRCADLATAPRLQEDRTRSGTQDGPEGLTLRPYPPSANS